MKKQTAKASETENLVLVVDDEGLIRESLTDCLSRDNIACIAAASPEKALRVLKQKRIALILLDWNLRGGADTSGAEVLRHCKEHYPQIPVIVMSGMDFDVNTDAIAKGADSFLKKPFTNYSVVVNQVANWLKRIKDIPKVFLPRQVDEILSLKQVKDTYIRHVVQLLDGNVSAAAEKLGVHRQTVTTAVDV